MKRIALTLCLLGGCVPVQQPRFQQGERVLMPNGKEAVIWTSPQNSGSSYSAHYFDDYGERHYGHFLEAELRPVTPEQELKP